MKSRRLLAAILCAWSVLVGVPAWAQCHASAAVTTFKKTPQGTPDLQGNFSDYGLLFHDVQEAGCYANAAVWLADKIEAELNDPSPGFREFLGGGDVYLAMASALVLGGRGPSALDAGLRARLDDLLGRVADVSRGGYRFDPAADTQCNSDAKNPYPLIYPASADNTCMEEYAAAAAAYAWMAAYESKTGRSPGSHIGLALQYLDKSFSLTDSVCVRRTGAGTSCSACITSIPSAAIPSDDVLYAGIASGAYEVVSYNGVISPDPQTGTVVASGENPNYGVGILTSVSAAVTGLHVAGSDWNPDFRTKALAQGLVREGQKRTTLAPAGSCAVDWTHACYNLSPYFPMCSEIVDCGDPGKGGVYNPTNYPVHDFLFTGGRLTFPDRAQLLLDGYAFDCPAFPTAPFANPSGFLGDARLAVYRDLAWSWPLHYGQPTLGGLDGTPPRMWVDVPQHYQTVSGSTNFYGWAIDAVSDVVSISFTIDGRPVYTIGYGGSRPDVCSTLGIVKPYGCYVGWGGFVDTTAFVNGVHTLTVTAADASGNGASYSRLFVVDNPVSPPSACAAQPAVGAYNASAFNAGYYDYLCGYYKYSYGYDAYGYCNAAVSSAAAAGVSTAGTGTCSAGTVYNYYAGLYDYYCRYYEYYGYGYDYGSYCYWSTYYASIGGCTGCGQSTAPACRGSARTIWIQPQWRAGFGPLNSLTVAGSASATGSCTSGGVDLYWRTSGGSWQHVPYSAPVGGDGIWYNSIENADPYAVYETYVSYQGSAASYCTYDGRNDIVWCP